MKHFNTLAAAARYRKIGFSVIPLWPKSKKPLLKWEPYQETRATGRDLSDWFANDKAYNIGIITGAVSGIVVLEEDGNTFRDGGTGIAIHPQSPRAVDVGMACIIAENADLTKHLN